MQRYLIADSADACREVQGKLAERNEGQPNTANTGRALSQVQGLRVSSLIASGAHLPGTLPIQCLWSACTGRNRAEQRACRRRASPRLRRRRRRRRHQGRHPGQISRASPCPWGQSKLTDQRRWTAGPRGAGLGPAVSKRARRARSEALGDRVSGRIGRADRGARGEGRCAG